MDKKEKEINKVQAYQRWLEMKSKGVKMQDAAAALAIDFRVGYGMMLSWLVEEARNNGELRCNKDEDEKKRRYAWERFVALRSEGFTRQEACQAIAPNVGRSWETVYRWTRNIEESKKYARRRK